MEHSIILDGLPCEALSILHAPSFNMSSRVSTKNLWNRAMGFGHVLPVLVACAASSLLHIPAREGRTSEALLVSVHARES